MSSPTLTEFPSEASRRRRRPNHVIAFGITAEEWDTLTDLAAAEVRDPIGQARWLVLQAIRAAATERAS